MRHHILTRLSGIHRIHHPAIQRDDRVLVVIRRILLPGEGIGDGGVIGLGKLRLVIAAGALDRAFVIADDLFHICGCFQILPRGDGDPVHLHGGKGVDGLGDGEIRLVGMDALAGLDAVVQVGGLVERHTAVDALAPVGLVVQVDQIGIAVPALDDRILLGVPLDVLLPGGEFIIAEEVVIVLQRAFDVVHHIAHGVVDHGEDVALHILYGAFQRQFILRKEEAAVGSCHLHQFLAAVGKADGEHRSPILLEALELGVVGGVQRLILLCGYAVRQNDEKLLGGLVIAEMLQRSQRTGAQGRPADGLPGGEGIVILGGGGLHRAAQQALGKARIGDEGILRQAVGQVADGLMGIIDAGLPVHLVAALVVEAAVAVVGLLHVVAAAFGMGVAAGAFLFVAQPVRAGDAGAFVPGVAVSSRVGALFGKAGGGMALLAAIRVQHAGIAVQMVALAVSGVCAPGHGAGQIQQDDHFDLPLVDLIRMNVGADRDLPLLRAYTLRLLVQNDLAVFIAEILRLQGVARRPGSRQGQLPKEQRQRSRQRKQAAKKMLC